METYRFEIAVEAADEQGGMEASDQLAGVCATLQEHGLIESVRWETDAPNDFQRSDLP